MTRFHRLNYSPIFDLSVDKIIKIRYNEIIRKGGESNELRGFAGLDSNWLYRMEMVH